MIEQFDMNVAAKIISVTRRTMKIWTPCTTFLWHLKWTTQKRPAGLKKYVKILSLMLCIWLSNGKTMTRFITISQSEQKKRLHGTNQKLKGKQTNY